MTKSNIEYTEDEKLLHALNFLAGDMVSRIDNSEKAEKIDFIGTPLLKMAIMIRRWAVLDSEKKGLTSKFSTEELYKNIDDYIEEKSKVWSDAKFNLLAYRIVCLEVEEDGISVGQINQGLNIREKIELILKKMEKDDPSLKEKRKKLEAMFKKAKDELEKENQY